MLEAKHLTKQYIFRDERGLKIKTNPVNDVSIFLDHNHVYSLIGESGSGKSTLARLLSAIIRPTSGEVLFQGQNLPTLPAKNLKALRSKFQLILQDGQSALDPRKIVFDSIAEPLRNLKKISRKDEVQMVHSIAEKVQLSKSMLSRYPNELSGGQQKRVCIARALCLSPDVVIFDESVSGLDITVQKIILDLLLKLQEEYKTTYLFITHDIDVALYMAQDIFVMKEGRILEQLNNAYSYSDFHHHYSRMLIESLPPKSPYER